MRKHIFYNTVNFQPVTFRILFFRGIQTLQMRLSRKACVWWTQILRPFCRAADVLFSGTFWEGFRKDYIWCHVQFTINPHRSTQCWVVTSFCGNISKYSRDCYHEIYNNTKTVHICNSMQVYTIACICHDSCIIDFEIYWYMFIWTTCIIPFHWFDFKLWPWKHVASWGFTTGLTLQTNLVVITMEKLYNTCLWP